MSDKKDFFLLWTTKSLRNIQEVLQSKGIEISYVTILEFAERFGLQPSNESKDVPHPDMDAQFKHINAKSLEFINVGQPVISVDAKQKNEGFINL